MSKSRRISKNQGVFQFMDEPALPNPAEIKGDKYVFADYFASIDQKHAVGKVPLKTKYERLTKDLPPDLHDEIHDELSISSKSDARLTTALETLDYARLRGGLPAALNALKKADDMEEYPLGKIRNILRLGIPLDECSLDMTEQQMMFELDFLNGGSGYGQNVRIAGDINWPKSKKDLAKAVEAQGVEKVVVKGGDHVPPNSAPIKQLRAIYATNVKKQRAKVRRAERMMDEI